MDQIAYSSLSRQVSLKRELSVVANNLANMSTTGFRAESILHSEFIVQPSRHSESISVSEAGAFFQDASQGSLKQTGGTFDFAIEGTGYFQLEGPEGSLLTRAGVFSTDANGDLVSMDGFRLLDAGGSPISVPANASIIHLASDGTLTADDIAIAQISVFQPADPNRLSRFGQNAYAPDTDLQRVPDATILQGFLENSNVNPLTEIARLIEIQRQYETSKNFGDREHDRISKVIDQLGR